MNIHRFRGEVNIVSAKGDEEVRASDEQKGTQVLIRKSEEELSYARQLEESHQDHENDR